MAWLISYFNDGRIWLNVGIGFTAMTILITVGWAIRVTDVVLLGQRFSSNVYKAVVLIGMAMIAIFQVWYDGYVIDHYHDFIPYVGAFIAGEILGLGTCFPLSKLGPRLR